MTTHPTTSRLLTLADPFWADSVACRGRDANVWFSDSAHTEAYAVRQCAVCPVRRDCLVDALRSETPATTWGVRGGVTAQARKSWLRRAGRGGVRSLPVPEYRAAS